VEIVPSVGLTVVGIAVDVAHTATTRRQDVVVPSVGCLHCGLSVAGQVVCSANSRSGRVPHDDVADFVVAPWLRRKPTDPSICKARRRTGLLRKVTLQAL